MKKGKKDVYDPYVKLDNDMTNSAAWLILSDSSIVTYIELRKSYNSKKGGNDHLVLSYRKMRWRYSFGTIKRAFQELIDWGFIRIKNRGGLGNPAVYALCHEWKKKSRELVGEFGEDAKDFKEAIRKGYYKRSKSKDVTKNFDAVARSGSPKVEK